MKAAIFRKYGGNEVVEISDVAVPVIGAGDVLIRMHSASINPVDWKVRYGQLKIITGTRFPKVLGNECAGEIVSTGSAVNTFSPGNAVIGWPGARRLGAFAEYVRVPQTSTFRIPGGISFDQAACIPIAGVTALQALRDKGRLSPGKQVLVNGASGGVGHFAVQIAKIYGAGVTAVCSRANAGFVRELGADRVIDYTSEDFVAAGERYDIIFDAVAKRSFGESKKALTGNGIYISTLPSFGVFLNRYITGYFTNRKARTIWVRASAADLEWIMDRAREGRIRIAVDRVYPLDQAKEALAYSETGKAKGKILLHAFQD